MRRVVFSCAAFVLLLGACGSTPTTTGSNTKKENPPTGTFDTDASVKPRGVDCTAAAELVYVMSWEHDLYAFAPDKVTFTKIGRVDCPSAGEPNSMAIDRSGFAYVNYTTGELYKVSTDDASCTKTSYEPNQGGFATFGMAFATNGAGSKEETLYVSGLTTQAGGGKGLGKIDLETFKLTVLGDYTGPLKGQGAELTGTGDGRLFGFFTTQPNATLAEIDKAQGGTSNDQSLQGVNTGLAWAFSFWGGDFWFYTSDGISPSEVTQLKKSTTGEIAVAKSNVGGFRIVGAGVSTCAPTAPPK